VRLLQLAVQPVTSSNYDELLVLQNNLFDNASSIVLSDSTHALPALQPHQQGRPRDQAPVASPSAIPGLTGHVSFEGTEFGMGIVPSSHDAPSETNQSQ